MPQKLYLSHFSTDLDQIFTSLLTFNTDLIAVFKINIFFSVSRQIFKKTLNFKIVYVTMINWIVKCQIIFASLYQYHSKQLVLYDVSEVSTAS